MASLLFVFVCFVCVCVCVVYLCFCVCFSGRVVVGKYSFKLKIRAQIFKAILTLRYHKLILNNDVTT